MAEQPWQQTRSSQPGNTAGDGKARDAASPEQLSHSAEHHYQRGNRFYDQRAWDLALREWRRAAGLWQAARDAGSGATRRFVGLRAVVAFLLTVLLVYNAIFTLFPRDAFEMMMFGGGTPRQEDRSWLERFLDTGRPRLGDSERIGVREWWSRFRRNLFGEGEEGREGDSRLVGRPAMDERWSRLLRRYGRWGPYYNWQMDYSIVSGYGLSRLGDYERAVEVFRQALEEAESPEQRADLYQGLANAHYYQGYRLQQDGLAQYDLTYVRRATEAYERSVEHDPRPLSYGNLGWMYFLLGEYEQAQRYSQRALSMNPGLEYVRLNIGLTHLMQGDPYEAFRAYRDVIESNPPEDTYLGGITDLKEVIRDDPGGRPFAYLMVGLLTLQTRDYADAREHLNRFLSFGDIGSDWRDLARRLLEHMDVQEAVE